MPAIQHNNTIPINHFSKGYNRLSEKLIKINESYDCVDVCGNSSQNTSKIECTTLFQ